MLLKLTAVTAAIGLLLTGCARKQPEQEGTKAP